MARVVATEGGGDRFIVQTNKDRGYLIDIQRNYKSEIMNIQTLIKGGYWQEYKGRLTPKDLDKRLKENKRQ